MEWSVRLQAKPGFGLAYILRLLLKLLTPSKTEQWVDITLFQDYDFTNFISKAHPGGLANYIIYVHFCFDIENFVLVVDLTSFVPTTSW